MYNQEKQNLFMASISHELRTPLTSILGYGELLEQTKLNKKQEEYLKRMLNSSKYLLSLVGDFLDIVKFEKNDINLEEKEVCLHTILTECADVIKTNLHKNTTLKTDIPFLDYTILADSRRVKQVILNILSNAAKFTEDGIINFYVKDIEYIDDRIKIVINIEDAGTGISKEMQKALFDPFITTDSTQGFGLGLFISKEIVKLMDGEIKLVSKEGEGSTFSISFFVHIGDKKNLSLKLSNKKILMLSDEIEFTEKFSDIIKKFNASFSYYSPSRDISDNFKKVFSQSEDFDLAIFDMNYIKYDISNIISTLRLIQPNIKCIGLLDNYSFTCASSFDTIINTPIKAEKLIYQIEELFVDNSDEKREALNFSNLKVLIVEDVEMNRNYIKEMLKMSFSIFCDTAINGKDALEKSIENDYDIIFMDIRMPVMNGYEATIEIRKLNKDMFIVCMSADVYESDIQSAKDSGMDAFIEKPLEIGELKDCFTNFINGETRSIDLKLHKSQVVVDMEESIDVLELKSTAYSHLENIFDKEIVIGLIAKAVESIEFHLSEIDNNISKKDAPKVTDNFHAIKGVLVNLGLKDEADRAGEIQQLFKIDKWNDGVIKKDKFIKDMINFVKELKNS